MGATAEIVIENPQENVYRLRVVGNKRIDNISETGNGIWIEDFSHLKCLGIEGNGEIPVIDAEEGYDINYRRNDHDQLVMFTVSQ